MLFGAADFPPLGAASPPRRRGRNDHQRPAVYPPQEQRPPAETTEVLVSSLSDVDLTASAPALLEYSRPSSTAYASV